MLYIYPISPEIAYAIVLLLIVIVASITVFAMALAEMIHKQRMISNKAYRRKWRYAPKRYFWQ